MITFSINGVMTKDKAKKIAKIIKDMDENNLEFVSTSFFAVMNDKGGKDNEENMDLLECTKKARIDRVLRACREGELEEDVVDPISYTEDAEAKVDLNFYVESFLELRETLFFSRGVDIWRLFSLVLKGDVQALKKFRVIMEEMNFSDFMRQFCSHLEYIGGVRKVLGP